MKKYTYACTILCKAQIVSGLARGDPIFCAGDSANMR